MKSERENNLSVAKRIWRPLFIVPLEVLPRKWSTKTGRKSMWLIASLLSFAFGCINMFFYQKRGLVPGAVGVLAVTVLAVAWFHFWVESFIAGIFQDFKKEGYQKIREIRIGLYPVVFLAICLRFLGRTAFGWSPWLSGTVVVLVNLWYTAALAIFCRCSLGEGKIRSLLAPALEWLLYFSAVWFA